MTRGGYTRQDVERRYNDGFTRGKKQGKKDMLAKFRVYLTSEEARVEMEKLQ